MRDCNFFAEHTAPMRNTLTAQAGHDGGERGAGDFIVETEVGEFIFGDGVAETFHFKNPRSDVGLRHGAASLPMCKARDLAQAAFGTRLTHGGIFKR